MQHECAGLKHSQPSYQFPKSARSRLVITWPSVKLELCTSTKKEEPNISSSTLVAGIAKYCRRQMVRHECSGHALTIMTVYYYTLQHPAFPLVVDVNPNVIYGSFPRSEPGLAEGKAFEVAGIEGLPRATTTNAWTCYAGGEYEAWQQTCIGFLYTTTNVARLER
jgi:hypothetical protein